MSFSETPLEQIIAVYLSGRDFNGFPVRRGEVTAEQLRPIGELIRADLVQVVSENDYPNPHIRPWPSKRTQDDQVKNLFGVATGEQSLVCLYPTPMAMLGRVELDRWLTEPYRRALASGRGHLEVAYFTLDVLEAYRNDPRYHYRSADFEALFGISDEAYVDEGERDRDKITSIRAGFAYDSRTIDTDEIRRYVCTFFADLADLTPEHQRRWESFEQTVSQDVHPHPAWWRMQMGEFPDGIGPFEKILSELRAINDLFSLAWGKPLFRTTERPREWGWVMRATTGAWQEFVHVTDKLLSDNISHDALTAAGVVRNSGDDEPLGSIARLERFLTEVGNVPSHQATANLEPLRLVRAERRRPAHVLEVPKTDPNAAARQRDLLASLGLSLEAFRKLLMTHRAAIGWTEPAALRARWYRL